MLMLNILCFEVIPNFGKFLVLFVVVEKFRLDLVGPYPVDLKLLILETATGFELLIAAHGIIHAVELHLP